MNIFRRIMQGGLDPYDAAIKNRKKFASVSEELAALSYQVHIAPKFFHSKKLRDDFASGSLDVCEMMFGFGFFPERTISIWRESFTEAELFQLLCLFQYQKNNLLGLYHMSLGNPLDADIAMYRTTIRSRAEQVMLSNGSSALFIPFVDEPEKEAFAYLMSLMGVKEYDVITDWCTKVDPADAIRLFASGVPQADVVTMLTYGLDTSIMEALRA